MKAMIFAAGLGTRMRPLTHSIPKALVKVDGVPLVEHVIVRLKAAGITDIIINLHHFPEQIIDFLDSKGRFDLHIEFSMEEVLLETGGGLKQAAWFFDDEPFIVHNVDILSNINLTQMVRQHFQTDALATLAVMPRKSSRYFMFDSTGQLCGWKSVKTGQIRQICEVQEPVDLAFCGIQVLSPEILPLLTEEGVFSIVESYLRLAGSGEKIEAFRADSCVWRDVGKYEELE